MWGETYAFREWLGEETGTQPGGGIAKYDIQTPAPGTDTPINMAWAFDGRRLAYLPTSSAHRPTQASPSSLRTSLASR